VYSAGEVQAAKSAPSSEHSKVALGSSDEKVTVAFGLALGDAGPATVVSGGMATVQA
jgi:hypothetical protein